jgi:hypothetical protein
MFFGWAWPKFARKAQNSPKNGDSKASRKGGPACAASFGLANANAQGRA